MNKKFWHLPPRYLLMPCKRHTVEAVQIPHSFGESESWLGSVRDERSVRLLGFMQFESECKLQSLSFPVLGEMLALDIIFSARAQMFLSAIPAHMNHNNSAANDFDVISS